MTLLLSNVRTRSASFGCEVPRLWTRPLRELSPETSRGFEVIDFAESILGVELYPWQKWLLTHALEVMPDGSYRFSRVVVLVARQNGKSLLASVLSAWWLFVDSERFPERVPPVKFRVLGTAQNLDTARDVWMTARQWCDPDVDSDEDENVCRALQGPVRRVSDTNGKEEIILRSGARYLIRAASRKSGRGKSAPRVLMDEMREQLDWEAWNSVAQTTKSFFSNQLFGFSNAGDSRSVVLNKLRDAALSFFDAWDEYVASGVKSVEEFANGRDVSLGWFEWSAPDGCPLDDEAGILQANPSTGYSNLTVESIRADIQTMTEAGFRTEVLCQWVTALVETYLDAERWGDLLDVDSCVADGSRMVLGVDVSGDRSHSYVAVAGFRGDAVPHAEVIADRAGILWVPSFVEQVAKKQNISDVALQIRGCPASELVEPLRLLGMNVVEVSGSALGASTGQMRDRVRDGSLRHLGQPVLDLAVSGAVTKRLGEVQVWDRGASVVDVAPLVAVSAALYGLESAHVKPPLVSAYVVQGDEDQPDWW